MTTDNKLDTAAIAYAMHQCGMSTEPQAVSERKHILDRFLSHPRLGEWMAQIGYVNFEYSPRGEMFTPEVASSIIRKVLFNRHFPKPTESTAVQVLSSFFCTHEAVREFLEYHPLAAASKQQLAEAAVIIKANNSACNDLEYMEAYNKGEAFLAGLEGKGV